MTQSQAVTRTLTTLRFFRDSPQGMEPDATGYKGFYYHFLDMNTGRRAWECELSTVDSAFLLAGMLSAAAYFSGDTPDQREIRELADMLYQRADWQWAQNGGETLCHGWKPETGFLPYRWQGYNEGMLMYVLALASPTHALPVSVYTAWCSTYEWKTCYDIDYLYAGPLFIHQLSHVWIDFRGIKDAYMRGKGIDYFENSRRATYVQQRYAIENPSKFEGYGEHCWGITASDGPGPADAVVKGVQRHFFDYEGRGAPYGIDDGTLSPWAVVASLPFSPEIVLPSDPPLHAWTGPARQPSLRIQVQFQSQLSRGPCISLRLGFAVALRIEHRPDRADDRKPSQRHAVEADAWLQLHRRWIATGGVRGWVVGRNAACPRKQLRKARFCSPLCRLGRFCRLGYKPSALQDQQTKVAFRHLNSWRARRRRSSALLRASGADAHRS